MKRTLFLIFVVVSLIACNQNVPVVEDHQPKNPATWSPVGHKYVSTDSSNYKIFLDREITFFSKDSFLWIREGHAKNIHYRLEYPYLFIRQEQNPWLQFVDTLTITYVFDGSQESKRYELIY